MKILFLIYSFNIGGIERLIVDMCRSMNRQGHQTFLCVINHDYTESMRAEVPPETEWICLERPAGDHHYLTYMNRLASVIKDRRIDVIHCHGINCVLLSGLASLKSPHAVILNTVHDKGDYLSYSDAKIFLQNRICDHTIAISESVGQDILSRHMDPRKVSVIYNATDTSKFQYCPATHIPSSDAPIEIVNVARFLPAKKGQDLLIEAVLRLLPQFPNIHCTFAGAPANGYELQFEEMKDKVRSLGISSHITFAGNVNDIPELLRHADLFVLPSRFEGFGISLIEAMSMGIPSVASRLDGPSEIINSDRYGRLFTPGDAGALADAICDVLTDLADYDRKEISDYIHQRFDINSMVSQHLALYRSLLH